MYTKVKTASEIASMRESGKMLARVLAVLSQQITEGMTTKDLAIIAASELKTLGGKPAFLGYEGFPDVLCVSINDEIVHGIPSRERVIKKGDIVGLDFGVNYRGMITDAAVTRIVGGTGSQKLNGLVNTTRAALDEGIAQVKEGVFIGDIAHAVQTVLEGKKLGIIRDLVGHGVGHKLHEEPNIPNYGTKGSGAQLIAGMTIAIEPMATVGGEDVYIDKDRWTVKTKDGSYAAHFEHTVLITETGAEILTAQ